LQRQKEKKGLRANMAKRTFFQSAYVELSKVQVTKNKRDFDRLARKITPRLLDYARWIKRQYPTSVLGPEDYAQEGLIALWNFIHEYRYTCPNCEYVTKDYYEYISHCKIYHEKVLKPKSNFEKYLNFRIKRYMRNHMLAYVKPKIRAAFTTVYLEDLNIEVWVKGSCESPHKEVASKQIVRRLRQTVEKEKDERIRIFIKNILRGVDGCDTYKQMAENGISPNEGAARACIYQFRKGNKLAKYRNILTA
jgi:hypothetical protein